MYPQDAKSQAESIPHVEFSEQTIDPHPDGARTSLKLFCDAVACPSLEQKESHFQVPCREAQLFTHADPLLGRQESLRRIVWQ